MSAIPFVPVPDSCTVQMVFDVFGQKCENVYGVDVRETPTVEIMTTLAAVYRDWFINTGKSLTNVDVELSKIIVTSLASATAPAIDYIDGLPIAGTDAINQPLPLNVTAAISFHTALRGRSYRGRVYQIGLVSTDVVDNQLTDSTQGLLIDGYGALVEAISTAGFVMGVISRMHNKAYRTTGIITPINSVSVDINLDSQRRRLTGRGQ